MSDVTGLGGVLGPLRAQAIDTLEAPPCQSSTCANGSLAAHGAAPNSAQLPGRDLLGQTLQRDYSQRSVTEDAETKWGYRWPDVEHLFAYDGTLATIEVRDVTDEDWCSLLFGLFRSDYAVTLYRDGEEQNNLPAFLLGILSPYPSASFHLSVDLDGNVINGHRFQPDEISFDFDCYDVNDQDDLDELFGFCSFVQQTIEKTTVIEGGLFIFDSFSFGQPTGPFFRRDLINGQG